VTADVRVVVDGHNLPGSSCGPHNNVHVGLQVGAEPDDLVSGSAGEARWTADIRVVDVDQGHDFRGKAVHGKRAERFLYLTWGEVDDDRFTMFRRAKLMLDRIDPKLVTEAIESGAALHAKVDLTDPQGMPRCARVDPPAIEWSLLDGDHD
jgi:hypothetical protein